MGFGDHSGKVLITLEVPGEQRLVVDLVFGKLPGAKGSVFRQVSDIIRSLGLPFGPIRHFVVVDQIDLTSDDRLDPLLFGAVIEVNGAKKIPMVGHRNCRHLQLGASAHQTVDAAASIQKTVVGMKVKMNERGIGRHGHNSVMAMDRLERRESAERGVESTGFESESIFGRQSPI
ncbi:MAG: hypothetical protein BWY82_00774 [Verrucomicrobia bacterium ADurb.Bin474]|nr:MAG: hypothetical protein BWY82_00774 [Verrucomicrobia bacterium ADurb.Bin474]